MALPPRSEDAGQGQHEAASLLKGGEKEERVFPWQKKEEEKTAPSEAAPKPVSPDKEEKEVFPSPSITPLPTPPVSGESPAPPTVPETPAAEETGEAETPQEEPVPAGKSEMQEIFARLETQTESLFEYEKNLLF